MSHLSNSLLVFQKQVWKEIFESSFCFNEHLNVFPSALESIVYMFFLILKNFDFFCRFSNMQEKSINRVIFLFSVQKHKHFSFINKRQQSCWDNSALKRQVRFRVSVGSINIMISLIFVRKSSGSHGRLGKKTRGSEAVGPGLRLSCAKLFHDFTDFLQKFQ